MFYAFPIQNGLNQEVAVTKVLTLLQNTVLEGPKTKGLKHRELLMYADNVNEFGGNRNVIKKITDALFACYLL